MVEVSLHSQTTAGKEAECTAQCLVVPEALAGEGSLDLRVATFIDLSFHFYAADAPRCPACLQCLDHCFAAWHERAGEVGLPLGLVYMSLCDGAYYKTLDIRFKRRNGWARKTISTALALWPEMPRFQGSLCSMWGPLNAPPLRSSQSPGGHAFAPVQPSPAQGHQP